MTIKITPDETPVSWILDNIEIDASLTRPDGSGPFPAVIMVAGSGPTDRNWNSPLIPGTNGSAALYAQALTDLGYVTLRYDKRASGPNGRENAMRMTGKISMQSHLEELAGGVRLLAERKDVDPRRIFALTNSEGCIHALNYQNQAIDLPFAGLVLSAAPARPIGAVGRSQIEAQLKPVPGGEAWLAAYDAAIADFSAGRPVKVDESLPEGIRNLLMGLTTPVNQPFARELWLTDPLALATKVKQPILVLIGKKDTQVDWLADGVIFDEAVKTHPNLTIVYPENANHVLKYEPRERASLTPVDVMNSYNSDGSVLDKESLEIVTSWLLARTRW